MKVEAWLVAGCYIIPHLPEVRWIGITRYIEVLAWSVEELMYLILIGNNLTFVTLLFILKVWNKVDVLERSFQDAWLISI